MKHLSKKIIKITLLSTILFLACGCKSDDMEDISIVTSNYPNEYIIDKLYGEHAHISPIYPDGVNPASYVFTKKQKQDFASQDLFIYTGLTDKERELAVELLDFNHDLKIIDSSYVLENDYHADELWSDPSFMLMMSQNIRIGLKEYVDSTYLKKEIDENYEQLKVDVSELDANIRLAVESAPYKTIVATDNSYKFLEKYGLSVYILNDETSNKDLAEITKLIASGKVTKIFSYKDIEVTKNVQNIINTYPNIISYSYFNRFTVISDEQRQTKSDYLTLMNQNLDSLKEEIYHGIETTT